MLSPLIGLRCGPNAPLNRKERGKAAEFGPHHANGFAISSYHHSGPSWNYDIMLAVDWITREVNRTYL